MPIHRTHLGIKDAASDRKAALRRHASWALGFELAFFLFTLAIGTSVASEAHRRLTEESLRVLVKRLRREFEPVTAIHSWPHLALAIFGHNLELMLPILLFGMLAMWLASRGGRLVRVAAVLAVTDAVAALLFLLENITVAGLLIGYVAERQHTVPIRVFATLLPHGVFEIFALSWAFSEPLLLVWGRLSGVSWQEAAAPFQSSMLRGAVYAVLVLALAALIESTVSPVVTRALIPVHQARTASASISTHAPRGSAAMPTVTRAGRALPRTRA